MYGNKFSENTVGQYTVAPSTTRSFQIPGECEAQADAIKALSDIISTLEIRLTPVLAPEGPSEEKMLAGRPSVCPIGDAIARSNDALHAMAVRVEKLIRRLEL